MKSISGKKGAMEMSVGTIVTIVLLMGVLVLGIFLVQKIFRSGSSAIDTLDSEIQNQISKLFAEDDKKLAVYPTSREITVKKGDEPKGFAFSVRSNDVESAEFTYEVEAQDASSCGSTLNEEEANDFLLSGSGSFSLGPGSTLDLARLVKFNVPESAPPCTIVYNLGVKKDAEAYSSADIFVTIK